MWPARLLSFVGRGRLALSSAATPLLPGAARLLACTHVCGRACAWAANIVAARSNDPAAVRDGCFLTTCEDSAAACLERSARTHSRTPGNAVSLTHAHARTPILSRLAHIQSPKSPSLGDSDETGNIASSKKQVCLCVLTAVHGACPKNAPARAHAPWHGRTPTC